VPRTADKATKGKVKQSPRTSGQRSEDLNRARSGQKGAPGGGVERGSNEKASRSPGGWVSRGTRRFGRSREKKPW